MAAREICATYCVDVTIGGEGVDIEKVDKEFRRRMRALMLQLAADMVERQPGLAMKVTAVDERSD